MIILKYPRIRFLIAVWVSFMVATVGPVFFSDMLTWTAPIVCPAGRVYVQTDSFNPSPGETSVNHTLVCSPVRGASLEISGFATLGVLWLYAILPSLLIAFFLPASVFAWLEQIGTRPRPRPQDAPSSPSSPGSSATDRLRELQQALDAGLITRREYEQKRREILKEM